MTEIIDGKKISAEIKGRIKENVAVLKAEGRTPGLAAVLVGDNPASVIYVRNKRKACEEVGIYSEEHKLPASTKQEDLLNLILQLNNDPKIHGILVQLPLPKHLDTEQVLYAVSPKKDVDGLHPNNVGHLTMGSPVFVPCTPAGVMAILDYHKIPIEGRRAVIVGRSNLVGRPVGLLLMHRNATITVCHSRTRDIGAVCREGDILIAAIGKPRFITADMVKNGAAVIDVGINRLPDGKLVGDVDYEPVSQKAGWITPVPGGVGPMTIAMLLQNTLEAAGRSR
ncbi:MAG TPA: bifunctional methylenetetrahydrofolate dehydrogenase/methenyltetrahydrofolate cyclohydrolase FolD [Nitrospiria bacterium]|nr:bifunctional methylenetetrahydrofolate dehydrogenase/methenyltetrahydrofolate cyclohydrolase FolD [Nitrospiria bacterium]